MDKKVLNSESNYANIISTEKRTMTDLKVATFCVVAEVDEDKKTITARPVVGEKIELAENTYDYAFLPDLVNVPYCTNMKKEPEVGDFCICIHLDRGISGYSAEDILGGKVKDDGIYKHSLSNCVAIVGF